VQQILDLKQSSNLATVASITYMKKLKGNVMLPLNLTFLLFFFFYSLFPLLPSVSYDFHNGQRIAQIFLLFACALHFISRKEISIPKNNITFCITAFLALSFFSSSLSSYPHSSIMNSLHYTMLALLTFSLINTAVNNINFYRVLFYIHTSLLLVCSLNIVFSLIDQQPIKAHNIMMKFDNIRHFNHIQILLLPLSLYIYKHTKYKVLIGFSITLNLVFLFLSNSLASLLCLALIFALLLKFKLNEIFKNSIILLLVSIVFFSAINFYDTSSISSSTTNILNDSGRIEMWSRSVPELSNIFLGVGPGNYSIQIGGTVLSHPHNFLIQILNESGIIALFLVLYLLWIIAKEAALNTENEKLIFITFITTLFYALASGLIVMPVSQTIIFLLLSQLIPKRKKIPFNNYFKVIIISFSLIYFIISMTSAFRLDGYTPKMAGPSFWSAGEKNLDGLYNDSKK